MFVAAREVQLCATLLAEYRDSARSRSRGRRIRFKSDASQDVYNITAPFEDEGQMVIAGRVEHRNTEFSQVHFFVYDGTEWVEANGYPRFDLQDPFIARIHGELVFGGVRVISDEAEPHRIVGWVTEFYRGSTVRTLRHFATGPIGMKDIRLIELMDERIGVFTRPQGTVGGRGQIGYTTVASLDELTAERICAAPLLSCGFHPDEWGGCNEVHALKGGYLGVLGHIASFAADRSKHYYPIAFLFDPVTARRSTLKILAERSDFPQGPAKNSDLVDVLFSGGLVNHGNGTVELYVGVSDAEAHQITIQDPFIDYR